ncbi:MAG: SMI1/KNR4 family protein [Actinomycetota bacterium]
MAESESDTTALLARVIGWIESEVGEDVGLNEPADDEHLRSVEQLIGSTIPDGLRSWYLVANGQSGFPIFPDAYRWISLSWISTAHKRKAELFHGPDDVFDEAWWHPGLLPFAADQDGYEICIDLDGRNSGVDGEVLEWVPSDWPNQRTARTHPGSWAVDPAGFTSWLSNYANDLGAGRYHVVEGSGYLAPRAETSEQ